MRVGSWCGVVCVCVCVDVGLIFFALSARTVTMHGGLRQGIWEKLDGECVKGKLFSRWQAGDHGHAIVRRAGG